MAAFRAKTYANRDDKAQDKVGHVQVSGTVEAFADLLKGKNKEEFDEAVKNALKAVKP